MSRVLIGSSNVYRNYRASAFKKFAECAMIRCVELEAFTAQLTNLDPSETEVIVSVLENFLVKAAGSLQGKERDRALRAVVEEFVDEVGKVAKLNPGTRYVLIEPTLRPKIEWFDESLDFIKKCQKDRIQGTGLGNISLADVISRASQQFGEDGVHFTPAAGKIFVASILEASEKIFKSEFVDLDKDDPKPDAEPGASLEVRMSRLENDVEERRWYDNLLFARTREELDTISNKAKEDRIVMTGLTSSVPPPREWVQRKEWLRALVVDTLKKVQPDFGGKLGFINQGKNNGRDIPMVEVKCESVAAALAIRKSFAEKRKSDPKFFGRLYVANSVSLSTRVRVDIMKAIAKRLTNKVVLAHVAAYSSRPILHIKDVGKPENTSRAYTFVDAVSQFGGAVVQDDLEEAYRRAGPAFVGQMEQHFVLLRERAAPPQHGPRKGPEQASEQGSKDKSRKDKGSGKRTREEDASEESSSKSKK
jgi:hypothetical protein